MNRRAFSLSAAAALAGIAMPARAQAWPERPLKLVLSQPAGSGPDTIARTVAEPLARRLGQPVVVENRPGGQNAIGAQAAARAAPDGYTFYFGTAAALVTNVYLFKSLPYEPRKEFVPVGMVGTVPFALSVNASSSLKSLDDFIAFAKGNPGRLTVANEGPNTFGGMMTRLLAARAGVQVAPVPYVSVAAAVNDVVGGQAEALVSDLPSAAQMFQGGRLRPLAVTTERRVPGFEGIAPIAQTLPGFDFAGWLAIVAPTGTPAAAIQRFNRELDAVLAIPEVASRIRTVGPLVSGAGSPDQLGTFLANEHARWARLTAEIGVLPE